MDDGTSAELEDEDGEQMNAKQGSFSQAVLAGLIVAAGAWGIGKLTDNRPETTTVAAIATLTERVSTLTEQVKRLNEQPYARREDLINVENRVSGLDRRLDTLEQRASSPRR